MDGIIILNKEQNMTSRDAVNIVSGILKTKKVGHTGTLDPMATGVLVICVNKATKVVEFLSNDEKIYECEVTLGYESETEDLLSGEEVITKKINVREMSKQEVDIVLSDLIGQHEQMVPMYSAVKVNGKKLLDYALKGEVIENRPIKNIEIYKLERTSQVINENGKVRFSFVAHVSKGTFIRTLCTEIAKRLGTIGAMSALKRIKSGNFTIEDAVTIKDLEEGNYKMHNIREALNFEEIEVDEYLANKIKNGQKLEDRYDSEYITYIHEGEVLAVYKKYHEGKVKAEKVF